MQFIFFEAFSGWNVELMTQNECKVELNPTIISMFLIWIYFYIGR